MIEPWCWERLFPLTDKQSDMPLLAESKKGMTNCHVRWSNLPKKNTLDGDGKALKKLTVNHSRLSFMLGHTNMTCQEHFQKKPNKTSFFKRRNKMWNIVYMNTILRNINRNGKFSQNQDSYYWSWSMLHKISRNNYAFRCCFTMHQMDTKVDDLKVPFYILVWI